jgi:hypothetical protein
VFDASPSDHLEAGEAETTAQLRIFSDLKEDQSRPITMQRVSALLPSWSSSKAKEPHHTLQKRPNSIEKGHSWTKRLRSTSSATERLRIAASNNVTPGSSRSGREQYWPASLDRECDKAARILQSFCSKLLPGQDTVTRRSLGSKLTL